MKGDVHIPNSMLTVGHDDIPPQFLQIKKDDKFFSRLLSKESSKAESSFRVLYYGRTAGSIPFMWESQPGTPKHPFSDSSLPPLTPPPSYQFIPRMKTTRKNSKSNFLNSIFPRRNSKRSDNSKSASFSSSSSSSFSLPSTPMNKYTSRKNNGMPRSMSATHFGHDEDDDDHEQVATSPTSTLCFGAGIKRGGKFGTSTHPMKNVIKKAFSSIVGHGTA